MRVKYKRIAGELAREIQRGELAKDARLPGENELARRFDVSRGTIRQALSSLQQDGLIETWPGAGSFVTYDGRRLDERLGWSQALATRGVDTTADLIRLERMELPALAAELGLATPAFLAVDRVRRRSGGTASAPAAGSRGASSAALSPAISYEQSRLPWRPGYDRVRRDGLLGGSLSRTLESLGVRGVGGRENVAVAHLAGEAAALLDRPEGTAFLKVTRTVHDADGAVVERVTSLLDPAHFQLELTFGDQ